MIGAETPSIPDPEGPQAENDASSDTGVVLPLNPDLSAEQETELGKTTSRHPAGHGHTRAYRPNPPEPLA